MANAAQLKALLTSYSDADGERFISIATQIAADAARTGKSRLACDLKKLIDDIRHKQHTSRIGGVVPIARPSGELATVLSVRYPKTRLSEMILTELQQETLKRVLTEYRQQARLQEYALSAQRRLLLIGPPGCGKTMTSHALAGELKLPHFSVQLHALITKFMGETAAKLHAVFQAMKETRGVYLFDEFDAIGGERGARNDVGEIRRVLNSFLQFLEEDDSDSLVVAATNSVGMLDEALFRRFDGIITYQKPDRDAIRQLIRNRLAAFDIACIRWQSVLDRAEGLSHADVCRACEDAAKEAVLDERHAICSEAFQRAIEARKMRTPI
jgi:SpoVK/Ycf46/Vps4 family AAA+-type ATPase